MTHFVGVDISKASFDVAIVDTNGTLARRVKYAMDQEGFWAFYHMLDAFEEVRIVMESTGIYHLLLLHFLLEKNFTCHVVHPMRIKHHIQSSTLRKSKTDTKDAEAIAQFARLYGHQLPVASRESFSSVRTMLREYEALSEAIASLKIEIKSLVDRLFPELSKNTNIFTRSVLHLLLQAPSRKRVRNLKEKKIERILKAASGNKATLSAKEIRQWAKNSIGINDAGLEAILQSKIRRLLHTQQERATLQEAIEKAIDDTFDDDLRRLTSIPGIGSTTASHFLAEVGDINKFATSKQLCAYSGLDPAIYQSGSSLHTRGRITKRGNRSLRRSLWLMALGVIRHTDKFKAYYQKKRQEGKAFKQAVVAVANKLLRTLFAMLKNKSHFDPSLAKGGAVV